MDIVSEIVELVNQSYEIIAMSERQAFTLQKNEEIVARVQKIAEQSDKYKIRFEEISDLPSNFATLHQEFKDKVMYNESLKIQLADSEKHLKECQREKDDLVIKLMELKKEKAELSEKTANLSACLEEAQKFEKKFKELKLESVSLNIENINLKLNSAISIRKQKVIQQEQLMELEKEKNDLIMKLEVGIKLNAFLLDCVEDFSQS